jgi:hypothetical protein
MNYVVRTCWPETVLADASRAKIAAGGVKRFNRRGRAPPRPPRPRGQEAVPGLRALVPAAHITSLADFQNFDR